MLQVYDSVSDILSNIDIDSCCFALIYSDTAPHIVQLLTNDRGLHALKYRVNCVDFTRLSESYEHKLIKYSQYGFAVYVPSFRRSSVYNSTMVMLRDLDDSGGVYGVSGLTMLLAAETYLNSFYRPQCDYDPDVLRYDTNTLSLNKFQVSTYGNYSSKYKIDDYIDVYGERMGTDEYLESINCEDCSRWI